MSFPRYPEYKDSGVEWLGQVPAHWEVIPMRSVARLESGHTPSRQHPEWWIDCSVPWFTLADVWQIRELGTEIITETSEKISEVGLANSSARLLPAGTVMLSRTASVGYAAIMGVPMATTQDFANWVCGHSLLPKFLLQFFRAMKPEFERMKMGSTHNTIYMPDLRAFRCALPSVKEQSDIVAFLNKEIAKIDTLVAEQERLIELLQEKQQSVISNAVTRGLNPEAPERDSGIEWLGAVPAGWTVTPLRHLVHSVGQGWSPQCESYAADLNSEYGVLKVGAVNAGVFDPSENKKLPPELEPPADLAIRAGDLMISRANTRELVGSAAVADADYPRLLLCDKLYRLRFLRSSQLPKFIARYLATPAIRQQIELGASGASASMLNISQSVILDLPVPVPPEDEMMTVLEFCAQAAQQTSELIAQAKGAVDLLLERRAALITAAVTGQIDVRGLVWTEAA